MSVLRSEPKAQIVRTDECTAWWPGVWNWATDHCEEMYLGMIDVGSSEERNERDDFVFSATSPTASSGGLPLPASRSRRPPPLPAGPPLTSEKTCTVPWSELTASQVESKLKAIDWMSAASAPRRSSCSGCPECESQTRMSVPRSEAVASRVPSRLSARHESVPSCAAIRVGRLMSKSSTRKCPFCNPGHASTHALEEGLSAHSPFGLEMVSKWCISRRSAKL
mmetsp:Transcript_15357/g.36471  ORF Transcript_15357/g.36471 Transcript_15357/m.36471 type:complete len:223 (-) Transcript_15357:393-1061(-)